MSNEATLEKMHLMKLNGMSLAFQATMETGFRENFTADELAANLIDAEWEYRQGSKLNRLIRLAKFRYRASMEDLNFRSRRDLDKNMMLRFADCDWVRKKRNMIITGPTGVGKSFIACALGNQACMLGFRVLYFNAAKIFEALKLKRADGSYQKELKNIQRQDLLILDDFGLEHLDTQSRLSLLEILEDRHGSKSTVVTSQLPVDRWHEIIGDPTIADAICDRIAHSSHRIVLKGDSMRKKLAEDLQ